MVYVLFRCHYYKGARTGLWTVSMEDNGEPESFESREEATAAIESVSPASFTTNEYAREYRIIEGEMDSQTIRVERRLSKSRFS